MGPSLSIETIGIEFVHLLVALCWHYSSQSILLSPSRPTSIVSRKSPNPLQQIMDPQPPSYDEAMSEKVLEKPTAPETTTRVIVEDPTETTTTLPTESSDLDNLCPVCRRGHLQKSYSGLGICLAILLFPCGILCCLKLTDRVCDNEECGATY